MSRTARTPLPAAILRSISRILIYPAALCALSAIPPYLLGLTAPDGTPLHINRLSLAAAIFAASIVCRLLAAKLHRPAH